MILRPYQSAAVDCTWSWMRSNPGNPAIVLPTGAGKSPTMAELARQAVEQWGGRVGILAHVRELVSQNADKLRQLWPSADIGIYAAGLRRRDRFNRVICMQIQSAANAAHLLGRFDLLLIDEAHRIPLKGDGQYLQFIAECRRFNPNLRVIGLTATPYRLQGQAVPVCGEGNVLTDIAFEARITDLIRDGYLSPLITRAGRTRIDLSEVKTRGGEYIESDLAKAVDRSDLVEAACDEMCELAFDRQAWIVFAVSVAHAEHVRDALRQRGVACEVVHGDQEQSIRDGNIGAFQRGELRALVNVNVLSEGFDAPHIDCVVMLRPTKSPGLYYQQVGRGFRLSPNKRDCLVLDFAGNALEHGPVDQIKVAKPRAKKPAEVTTAPARECPVCHTIAPVSVRICADCGHQFPEPLRQMHDASANGAPILSDAVRPDPVRHEVTGVRYVHHVGRSGVPTLQVNYTCGLRTFREWVCLEHGGPVRLRAVAWWNRREPGCTAAPRTVFDAVDRSGVLLAPTALLIDPTGKYEEIVGYDFGDDPNTESGSHRVAA